VLVSVAGEPGVDRGEPLCLHLALERHREIGGVDAIEEALDVDARGVGEVAGARRVDRPQRGGQDEAGVAAQLGRTCTPCIRGASAG
jgi:hypothetical protein